MTRVTIEYNSDREKVFLPELTIDLFIGLLKPNQDTIDSDSYQISMEKVESKENDVVYANLDPYTKTCVVIEKEF